MKDKVFLIVDQDGVQAMRKSKTSLKAGQRGVQLNVEVPDVYFDQPFAQVDVTFSEKDIDRPESHVQVMESRQWMEEAATQMLHRLDPSTHEELVRALNRRMPDLGTKVDDWSLDDLSYSQLAVVIEEAQDRLNEKD